MMIKIWSVGAAVLLVITSLLVACNSRATLNPPTQSPAADAALPPPRGSALHDVPTVKQRHDDSIDKIIQSVEEARETVARRAYILDHRAAKDLP